jgi:multiple sugar transport system permease protein
MHRSRLRPWRQAYAFVLPAALLMAVFIVYPAVSTLWKSFFNAEGSFVGLQNFADFFRSTDTIDLSRFPRKSPPWGSLIHNAVWIVIHLPTTVILGLVLAVILDGVRGGPFIKSVIFLGMVIPMIVGGVLIRFLFDENSGIVPLVMRALGSDLLGKSWTAYPQTALMSLIIGSILLWTGFSLTMHSAGLSTIPRELYEAADVDGARPIRKFFSITVPMLAPMTSVVIAMTLLNEIKAFDIVYAATLGGPGGSSMVLSLQMYFAAFRKLDYNAASTVATVLTVFTLAVGIWMARRNMREERA